MFWCNSLGETGINDNLPTIDPVTVSHCIIAIDPSHLGGFSSGQSDDLFTTFEETELSTYDVILEMWYI